MKMRVADYIASVLLDKGVRKVFMLNGGMMMHLVDTLGRPNGLQYVCNHHEQASAMAADAYARLTGKLGVCYATSGPGATNILTGLAGAWQDSSPVLFVTGQSKSTQTIRGSGISGLRQFGTFEVDIVPMVQSVTKYAEQVLDPKTIRYHLEKAIYLAETGRPGPVLLDLPLDIQGAMVDTDDLVGFQPEPLDLRPSGADLALVLELLSKSSRPLILAGYGIRSAGAVDEFRALAERLDIPVVTSQLGKDVLYYDHPLFVGHSGPRGDRAGNFAVQTADLIISVGCSLHSQTTGWEDDLFAPAAIKVQVELDDAVMAREKVNVTNKVKSGCKEFIEAMLAQAAPAGSSASWRGRCASWKRRYPVHMEPHERQPGSINFYHFVDALSDALGANSCIVSDAGSSFYVMGQALRLKDGQRFISSGSMGAMGYALPAANGAAAAEPGRTAVCVTGDGSLMTNVHELSTMSQFGLNVKLFIINNDGYVSMRNTQRDFAGAHYVGADRASGVFIPTMQSLAESYELAYRRCAEESELASTINEVLSMDGPVLCEIIAPKKQKIIPAVTSIKLEDGRMQSSQIHIMSPLLPSDVTQRELESPEGQSA